MALLTRAELQRFQKFLEKGDFESAINLADRFGLDKDDVYKAQWSASDFGEEAIRDVLSQVEDRMWVVREAKDRLCPTYDAMNSLLNVGLRVTEPFVSSGTGSSSQDGTGDDKAWWFRCKRLRLLQYKDRLETFIGINNGRYSAKEYSTFRTAPLVNVGIGFAERGKTGALALLFNRHTYSLAPHILQILDSIPETLPPHNYSQLLPDASPPKALLPRSHEDGVESAEVLEALKNGRRSFEEGLVDVSLQDSTENVVKLLKGLVWPTKMEIVDWYVGRAREIDKACGLLENSVSLLDLAVGKGFKELEDFLEVVSDLCGIIFASDSDEYENSYSLLDWERLSTYEKFKLILDGGREGNIVERLRERAVPFLHRTEVHRINARVTGDLEDLSESFLVRWLKEAAKENKLSLCSAILADCCKEPRDNGLFKSEEELVEVALDCIYACSQTDEWNVMDTMLKKLPQRERDLRSKELSSTFEDVQASGGLRKGFMRALRGTVGKSVDMQMGMTPLNDETHPMSPRTGSDLFGNALGRDNMLTDELETRVRQAEGHVKAGKLLLQYQVPKPINYFIICKEDISGTKRLIRILLTKFQSRDLAKTDSSWATLWQDLRTLQEKAFPFLDRESLLLDFCQGMLKAGKFSLAKNYLKGTGITILRTEKAEKLLISVAREYFFSALTLDSPAIGKARQCLNLLSPSKALTTEINLINAITEQLPSLGVTLLPIQFRQLKDSMEVVKLAVSTDPGAYLNVPEIMNLARLLGLTSADDIASVEAVIAREAAGVGDFGLALDLCLGLVRKGHGAIWDLCATLGRGPDFGPMDLNTRKELIGFALGHCDEESVGELLSAWKEFDIMSSCNSLGTVLGRPVISLGDHEKVMASLSNILESYPESLSNSEMAKDNTYWEEARHALSHVISGKRNLSEQDWKIFARERRKALGFCCLHLPWLLEVSSGSTNMQFEGQSDSGAEEEWIDVGQWQSSLPKECQSQKSHAAALILHGLASYDFVTDDSLVTVLAHEAMSSPATKENDTVGCGYLLNLRNVHLGAELLEKELESRENHQVAYQALEIAWCFSSLQLLVLDLHSPEERRNALRKNLKVQRSHMPGGDRDVSSAGANFWNKFQARAVEKLKVAEESRRLQQMLPGVDVGRFITGDKEFIAEKIFSLVESARTQQEQLLPKLLDLADEYHVERWQVLVRYFWALLRADWTADEEIMASISGYWANLLTSSDRFSDTLEIYMQVVDTALKGLQREESMSGLKGGAISKNKNVLVRALVSLSSDMESSEVDPNSLADQDLCLSNVLNRLRHSVWQKLCTFAEDLVVPLPVRIFVLELLETVRKGRASRKDFWRRYQLGDEDLNISWGKWEAECGTLESLKQGAGEDEKGKARNVLLALRSTQVISSFWPSLEVTTTELASPEAAISFFNLLVETTSSAEQAIALKALLVEWEAVFGFEHKGGERKEGTPKGDASNYGDGEDWDEGWEEFGENSWTMHTLHSCWKTALQKLFDWGCFEEALSVLDAALLHPTKVLLPENEAEDLVCAIGLTNPSAALQIALLLPYNSCQVHGLKLMEKMLQDVAKEFPQRWVQFTSSKQKKGRADSKDVLLSEVVNQDLMSLVLSSGLLPTIAVDPSLSMVFSALCQCLGHLALQAQELQLSMRPSLKDCIISADKVPLCAVAFPFFVAELTKAKDYARAGALVLQFMRVHPALATWNAAYMALQRYLRSQADSSSVEAIVKRVKWNPKDQAQCRQLDHLKNTVQSLTCRLEEVLTSASKTLTKDLT